MQYHRKNITKFNEYGEVETQPKKAKFTRGYASEDPAAQVPMDLKWHDSSRLGFNIPSPSATIILGGEADPAADCLNGIAEGSTEKTRNGRKILMKSILVKGSVRWVAETFIPSTPVADSNVRLYLMLDTQTNGTQAGTNLQFINPGGSQDTVVVPFRDLAHSDRFRVLKTALLNDTHRDTVAAQFNEAAGAGAFTDVGECTRYFEWYVTLNIPVLYKDNGATISSIVDNSLHMIALTDSNVRDPRLSYHARLRFIDQH
jgi:hypothetical protein